MPEMRVLTDKELGILWEIQNCTNFKLLRGEFRGEEAAFIVYEADGDIYPVAKLLTPGDLPFIKGPPGLEDIEV